jgi:hypothetical protein
VAERFAQARETSGVDVVPKVQISGAGAEAGGGGAVQALMTLLLADKLKLSDDEGQGEPSRPRAA